MLDGIMGAFLDLEISQEGLVAYSYGAVLPVVKQLCGAPCEPLAADYLITLDYL